MADTTTGVGLEAALQPFRLRVSGHRGRHRDTPGTPSPAAGASAGPRRQRCGWAWTPHGAVGHGLYDHTSVLRLIEWRWELPPLTVRDATANNLADLLDFSHPQLEAPAFAVPGITPHQVCPVASAVPTPWEGLRHLARRAGFRTP
jgi:hypothetical protein